MPVETLGSRVHLTKAEYQVYQRSVAESMRPGQLAAALGVVFEAVQSDKRAAQIDAFVERAMKSRAAPTIKFVHFDAATGTYK